MKDQEIHVTDCVVRPNQKTIVTVCGKRLHPEPSSKTFGLPRRVKRCRALLRERLRGRAWNPRIRVRAVV